MTDSARQPLGPWFITAGLLHALAFLILPALAPEQLSMRHMVSLPRINILLADSREEPTVAPEQVQKYLAKPRKPHRLPLTPHRRHKAHIAPQPTVALAEAAPHQTSSDTPMQRSPTPALTTEAVSKKETTIALNTSTPSQKAEPPSHETTDNTNTELTKLLHGAINRYKRYPTAALRMAWQGTASVRFLLQQDGRLESLTLVHSSGYNALDRAALQAVQNISPFEPAQRYLDSAQTFKVDVVFNLYN